MKRWLAGTDGKKADDISATLAFLHSDCGAPFPSSGVSDSSSDSLSDSASEEESP